MTLIEAFSSGDLPKYAVYSISLYDPQKNLIGHYVDPQAFHDDVTIQ